MEYRGICEKYKDMAGKWRVRVLISDTDTIILKFQTEPTEQEVIREVAKLAGQIEDQKAQATADEAQRTLDAAKLALVKDIPLADLKTKLGVKSGEVSIQ